MDIRHLHFNIDRLFLLVIQGYNLLNLNFFSDEDLLSVRFLDNDLNFLDDLFSVALNEMSHFDKNFLLNLSNDLLFLDHRNFNDSFFNNFVGYDLFDDLSNVHLSFLGISNESWDLSVKIDSLSVGDHVGYLSFYFDVSIPLENLFSYNLNFLYSISGLSDVNRLFDYLLNLNVLLWARNLNRSFNFNDFVPLNNNLLVVFNFNNLLLVQRNNFLYLNIIKLLIQKYFFCNDFPDSWNFHNLFVLELNFNIFFGWIVYYFFNENWNLLNHFNSFLCE